VFGGLFMWEIPVVGNLTDVAPLFLFVVWYVLLLREFGSLYPLAPNTVEIVFVSFQMVVTFTL
jgi:hypothetical protein